MYPPPSALPCAPSAVHGPPHPPSCARLNARCGNSSTPAAATQTETCDTLLLSTVYSACLTCWQWPVRFQGLGTWLSCCRIAAEAAQQAVHLLQAAHSQAAGVTTTTAAACSPKYCFGLLVVGQQYAP